MKQFKAGDFLSETSHYTIKAINGQKVTVIHHATGKEIEMTLTYLDELCKSAVHYEKEFTVGQLDKHWTQAQIDKEKTDAKVGDLKSPGIRRFFSEIPAGAVFTVCFSKQNKPLTKKAVDAKKSQALAEIENAIEKAKKNKENMSSAAKAVLLTYLDNPILDFEPGEERILTGFKTQQYSEDGFYDCIDAMITTGSPVRTVNVNTISWLIYDNVKYIVE